MCACVWFCILVCASLYLCLYTVWCVYLCACSCVLYLLYVPSCQCMPGGTQKVKLSMFLGETNTDLEVRVLVRVQVESQVEV